MAIDLEDAIGAIKEVGLNVDDFSFAETDTTKYPKGSGVSVIQGTITATYKPIGKSSTYDNGSPSHWEMDFRHDLKAGFYSKS
jgi:hypothetical protein